MCSEINEISNTSVGQEKTLEEKVDALRKSLIRDKIISVDATGNETVNKNDEPSVMCSTLMEFTLPDREGPEVLRTILKDYPDLRAHFIGAYDDMGIEMSSDTKKALSIGIRNKLIR